MLEFIDKNQFGLQSALQLKAFYYKSKLQELVQADTKRTVSYEFVDVSGPQNAPIFVYNVLMDDIVLGTGSGSSKKEAQQEAAKDALSKMAK